MRYYKISFYKKFKIIIISIIFCSLIALVEKNYIGINIKKENKLNLKIKKIINNINIKKKEINSDSQKILNIFIDELTENLEEEKQIINKINLLIDEENNKSSFLNLINKFKIYLKNIKLKNKIYELIDYLTFFENIEMINVLNKLNKILYSKETSDEILNAYNLINSDEKYYLLLKELFFNNLKNENIETLNDIEEEFKNENNNLKILLINFNNIYHKKKILLFKLNLFFLEIKSLSSINKLKNKNNKNYLKKELNNNDFINIINIKINKINKSKNISNKNKINKISNINKIKERILNIDKIKNSINIEDQIEIELIKKIAKIEKIKGNINLSNYILKKLN